MYYPTLRSPLFFIQYRRRQSYQVSCNLTMLVGFVVGFFFELKDISCPHYSYLKAVSEPWCVIRNFQLELQYQFMPIFCTTVLVFSLNGSFPVRIRLSRQFCDGWFCPHMAFLVLDETSQDPDFSYKRMGVSIYLIMLLSFLHICIVF